MSTRRVTLTAADAGDRYRQALRSVLTADATGSPDGSGPDTVVWTDAGAELLLVPGRAELALDDGLVLVTLPVFTEQTGAANLVVPFAAGAPDAPAGLSLATWSRPSGPTAVLDRWSEPLISVTWDALLALAAEAAAPAAPSALSAAPGRLIVDSATVAAPVTAGESTP